MYKSQCHKRRRNKLGVLQRGRVKLADIKAKNPLHQRLLTHHSLKVCKKLQRIGIGSKAGSAISKTRTQQRQAILRSDQQDYEAGLLQSDVWNAAAVTQTTVRNLFGRNDKPST